MRQTYRILPVYTGDVSGVCSALYELGGMVVMHDPSGCNSTYNTHDEIRWYDRDSLIFLSGLCEPDAVMGNDAKLIDDVVRGAAEYAPAFIALCNSPIPYLTGTDFAGICSVIEKRTGIPSFYIPTNGMHDYVSGAGLAFEKLAEKLFEDRPDAPAESVSAVCGNRSIGSEAKKRSVNILGMTPLDFAAESSLLSLRRILEDGGWRICSVWAMGDTLEELKKAGEASVNLVVSAVGMRTARYLRKRFGTPWVTGVPVGKMKDLLLRELEVAADTGGCRFAYRSEVNTELQNNDSNNDDRPSVIVIGEPVMSCSIAFDCEKRGTASCVIAATEDSEGLLRRSSDRICTGEEEVEQSLAELAGKGTEIIADPMYSYVIPEGTVMRDNPHLAFSGRLYRSRFTDPFQTDLGKGDKDGIE